MSRTKQTIDTAFILGAGLGTRLRPYTDLCPKPLLEVGGRPIITYAMEHLRTIGVKRCIVNTHHLAHVYREAFPDNKWQGMPLNFSHESVLLDTAGGLKNIEPLLGGDERIIVYNGDCISDISLHDLLAFHQEKNAEVTLALRSRGTPLNVDIDARGRVCDLRHILGNKGVKSSLFTGIYIVERNFLARLEAGRVESVIMPLVRMIKSREGDVYGAVIDEGRWEDVGSVEAYERLRFVHG